MYTGVRPDDALIAEAAEFARAGNEVGTERQGGRSVYFRYLMQQRTVAGQLSLLTAPVRESTG